jgi:predicted dehydrogenase
MTRLLPPLNLAIAGLGRWGTHLLRNFLALPGARVVALVDPNRQRLYDLCDRFELTDTVTCYDSWPQALAHPGLAAVVVATPASTHYPMIKAALESGLHVLSEKPLTLESATSAALCQLAAAQQRQLMVDHTYLFHPAVQQGRDLCGQLGPPALRLRRPHQPGPGSSRCRRVLGSGHSRRCHFQSLAGGATHRCSRLGAGVASAPGAGGLS